MVIVCLHDLLSLAKKVCIVLNHNRLDAGWQLCVVLLLGMLCIWRRFPCSAGVERADMRMGGRNSGFKYGNGTVVTGFPIVERWSCYRSLPTIPNVWNPGLSDKSGDGRYHCRKVGKMRSWML